MGGGAGAANPVSATTRHCPAGAAQAGSAAASALVAALAAALLGVGCTATLARAGRPDLRGTIVGADPSYLYVDVPAHGLRAVPRAEVSDIDHPGNVAATAGAVLISAGLGGWLVASAPCSGRCGEGAGFRALVGLGGAGLGLVGLGLAVAGVTLWGDSTGSAEPFAGPPEALSPAQLQALRAGAAAP